MREIVCLSEPRQWAKARRAGQGMAGPFQAAQRGIGPLAGLPSGRPTSPSAALHSLELATRPVRRLCALPMRLVDRLRGTLFPAWTTRAWLVFRPATGMQVSPVLHGPVDLLHDSAHRLAGELKQRLLQRLCVQSAVRRWRMATLNAGRAAGWMGWGPNGIAVELAHGSGRTATGRWRTRHRFASTLAPFLVSGVTSRSQNAVTGPQAPSVPLSAAVRRLYYT